MDSTGLQATGKTMAWTPAGDTELFCIMLFLDRPRQHG